MQIPQIGDSELNRAGWSSILYTYPFSAAEHLSHNVRNKPFVFERLRRILLNGCKLADLDVMK